MYKIDRRGGGSKNHSLGNYLTLKTYNYSFGGMLKLTDTNPMIRIGHFHSGHYKLLHQRGNFIVLNCYSCCCFKFHSFQTKYLNVKTLLWHESELWTIVNWVGEGRRGHEPPLFPLPYHITPARQIAQKGRNLSVTFRIFT